MSNPIQIIHKALSIFLLHVTHDKVSLSKQMTISHGFWLGKLPTEKIFNVLTTSATITSLLPFPQPYIITVWSRKLKQRNEFYLPVHRKLFLTLDRKWWWRWRFSRSEAVRVRVWYTLWVMLRHIAWTSWNRIVKKRHSRNILFALKWAIFYHRSRHSAVW